MPDLTFDAVVCGGGNKALMLAMYLARYAGMSVGILERRHEIGGGLATEETAAPGFRGNTHANLILPWYCAPLYRDFPEFWEYGGQYDQYPVSRRHHLQGQRPVPHHIQPQERSHPGEDRPGGRQVLPRDAEVWLKMQALAQGDEFQRVQWTRPSSPRSGSWPAGVHGATGGRATRKPWRQASTPDSLLLASSPIRSSKEFFDCRELQYCPVPVHRLGGPQPQRSVAGRGGPGAGGDPAGHRLLPGAELTR